MHRPPAPFSQPAADKKARAGAEREQSVRPLKATVCDRPLAGRPATVCPQRLSWSGISFESLESRAYIPLDGPCAAKRAFSFLPPAVAKPSTIRVRVVVRQLFHPS